MYEEYVDYRGPVGPESELFTYEQVRAMVALMKSMGIGSISVNPKDSESSILVNYVVENKNAVRLIWSKDQ